MLTLKEDCEWWFSIFNGSQFSDELRVILGKFRFLSQRLDRSPLQRKNITAELPPSCWENFTSSFAWTFTGQINSQDSAAYFVFCLGVEESTAKTLHLLSAQKRQEMHLCLNRRATEECNGEDENRHPQTLQGLTSKPVTDPACIHPAVCHLTAPEQSALLLQERAHASSCSCGTSQLLFGWMLVGYEREYSVLNWQTIQLFPSLRSGSSHTEIISIFLLKWQIKDHLLYVLLQGLQAAQYILRNPHHKRE